MRFTVVTYGTEEDTRPLVAVCRGLIEAGHDVQLFADRSTLSSAKLLGGAANAWRRGHDTHGCARGRAVDGDPVCMNRLSSRVEHALIGDHRWDCGS